MTASQMVDAYRSGMTIKDLAAKASVAKATVWRSLKSAGVEMRRRGPKLTPGSLTLPTDPAIVGYVAGLFDGEGNLYWRRRTDNAHSARLTIFSTNAEVIEWLNQTMGGFVRWDTSRVERHGWKPMGRWEVNRREDTIALLRLMLPYLIIKRAAAKDAIAEMASRP